MVIEKTIQWLEKAVIGLNLCPFAKSVHLANSIRYLESKATNEVALIEDLKRELNLLMGDSKIETTLIIHPDVFQEFLDFNDFLSRADQILDQMNLRGIFQLASFHPQYQFAESETEIENYTNRSPFPTLHLLREDSISKAIASYPATDQIYKRNIKTLKDLGLEGWKKLFP